MSRLTTQPTPLAGVVEVNHGAIDDHCGYLMYLFCTDELAAAGSNHLTTQINHSYSAKRGAVRGLYFQYPSRTKIKLVSRARGRMSDITVNLRIGSPTFLQWHAVELFTERHNSLLVPHGFTHDLQALEDDCELPYLTLAPYVRAAKDGLNPTDSRLSIA